MDVDRFILRRLSLGISLGLFSLSVLSIPVLGLKGDDTYLSLTVATVGAVVFGFSIPQARRRHPPEPRGFSVVMPGRAPVGDANEKKES